jgi:hypothetical protein
MRIAGLIVATVVLAWGSANAQETAVDQLRGELARLRVRLAELEAAVDALEAAARRGDAPAVPAGHAAPEGTSDQPQAPALNTPPRLPDSRAEAYRKAPPRVDVLIQGRATAFGDRQRIDTFSLRKAELGVKGHVADNVDFSIELDPVRASDPFRRTYIRLAPHDRLHVKLGLEKAPIGLEELTATALVPFVDRSEVTDRFAAAEELGVHLESRWPRWLVQFAVTNGGRRLLRDDNTNKALTARIVWAPQSWLSVGAASMTGEAGSDRQARDRYTLELKLGSALTGFQGEVFGAQDGAVWSTAYYAAAFWARPTSRAGLTHIQPVLRYEHIDRSDHDRMQELRLMTAGVGLLFDEHRSKLQINFLKDLQTGGMKDEIRAQYQVEF